jgi:hypothetical protein
MGNVLSLISLVMALALAGFLISLSRGNARRIAASGGHGGRRPGHTPMAYAFSATFLAVIHIFSGLIGYRLHRGGGSDRWAGSVVWWEVWMGFAAAAIAVYLWRKGLRDLRSNVHVPELAGQDAAAPPSRRIEPR